MCEPMPWLVVHGRRIGARNDHPTGRGIRDRWMKRCTYRIKLADCALTEPFIKARQESKHPVARVPFGVRRLIEAEVASPLNVRKSCEPLVRSLHCGIVEGKPWRDEQNQTLTVAQGQTIGGTRKVTGAKCDLHSNPSLEPPCALADSEHLEDSSAQFFDVSQLL